MQLALPYTTYDDFHGGMDDNSDAMGMSDLLMREIKNMYIDRKGLSKRFGYQNRNSETLENGAYVHHCHQWIKQDSSYTDTLEFLYFLNGKIYRDNGTTRTDVTNSQTTINGETTDAHKDREIQTTNYDGWTVITDQVNPPLVWPYNVTTPSDKSPDASGVCVKLSSVIPTGTPFPTTANTVATAWNYLFLMGVTDIDGVFRGNRILFNRPGRIAVWESTGSIDLDEQTDQIMAAVEFENRIIIWMRRNIFALEYLGADGPGGSRFRAFLVERGVGTLSAHSIVKTPEGLFWLDDRGAYAITPGTLKPRFIGKPMSTFWSSVNLNYRRRINGCDVPDKNSVVWNLPYGDSQIANNRGLAVNYEEWHRDGRYLYPAFSYFVGTVARPYEFSASLKYYTPEGTESNLAFRDGIVFDLDKGHYDETSTTGIEWSFKTPFYAPHGKGRVKVWYRAQIDAQLLVEQDMTFRARMFAGAFIDESDLVSALRGSQLGAFILGTDRMGSESYGNSEVSLTGESRSISLECIGDSTISQIKIHQIQLFYDPIGTHSAFA